MLGRLAGAALAAGLVLAAPAAHAALSPAQLLARYQPVIVLHPDEPFRPVPVTGFLTDSALETRAADGTWTPVDPPPATLPFESASSSRLNVRQCTADAGVEAQGCYTALEAAHAARSVVYATVRETKTRIALEYWYFYSYDLWSGRYPPSDDVWQAHEGDWEAIAVVLTKAQEPLLAGYSRHCSGARRAWSKVPKWRGTHPLAYAALGSHGNLFAAGSTPIDLRCYPPAAAALLKSWLTSVVDMTGSGTRLGPAGSGMQAAIVRVTDASPSWMRFPGAWGETNLFHGPGLGTVTAGPGPEGPAFHALWRDPAGTVARWPAG